MRSFVLISAVFMVIIINLVSSQIPQRLQIPGAILLQQMRARIQRPHIDSSPHQRGRRPIPNAIPAPLPIRETVRPVVEEAEEPRENSDFDNEVARLSLSSVQSSPPQEISEEEFEEAPKPVAFRPERPIPVLRSDVRDSPRPVARPAPVPNARPVPIANVRQAPIPNARPVPISRPVARPVLRPELEEENIPIRKPVQQVRQQAARQPPRIQSRPQYSDDDDNTRRRKPPVQILRKYRTDNEDGSITWGYENEDGTFKEETLGADCITRGKYGYIDPDGVRREYNYETGSKCDDEEELREEIPVQTISSKTSQRRPY